MSLPKMILASTSPTRRRLMEGLGLPFEAVAPDFEERVDPSLLPRAQAERLSRGKAEVVATGHPDALVIGADQLVWFQDELWGKPANEADALFKLSRLSGKTHELITGLAVIWGDRRRVETEMTRMTMCSLSSAEVARYVATGEWQGCAGGYRVEGRGMALFARIDGDYANVLGLPMLRLVRILREWGIPVL